MTMEYFHLYHHKAMDQDIIPETLLFYNCKILIQIKLSTLFKKCN